MLKNLFSRKAKPVYLQMLRISVEKMMKSHLLVSEFMLIFLCSNLIQTIPHQDQSFFVVLIFRPDRPENKTERLHHQFWLVLWWNKE